MKSVNLQFILFVQIAVSSFVIITVASEGEYQAGDSGAEWRENEIDVVREKVMMLLSREPEHIQAMFGCCEGGPNNLRPVSEMALFRLAFHDCFTYKDGSGGCDGCLNGPLNGDSPPSPFPSVSTYCEHQHPKVTKTDNNGLDRMVKYLEKIYTEPEWPPGVPSLPQSLKSTGKSRADLWQFAANVALEKTIERSNHGCRYDYFQRQQVPLLENQGLGFAYGVWKCKIKLEKPMKFKFGRKDCVPSLDAELPYITEKEEAHSNPHANADVILADVKQQLNMSAIDLIALSSIHGMIHPFGNGAIGTKYNWMGSGPNLSNMYYKILANRPTYDIGGNVGFDMKGTSESGNLNPFSVGDENGQPVAMWGMRVSCSDCWNTTQLWAGGPCHWRPSRPSAPDAPNRTQMMRSCFGGWDENNKRVKDQERRFCENAPITFTAEGIQKGNSGVYFLANGAHAGWSNMFMLNYEAGLYKKFDIDDAAMRGTGCDGINLQNPDAMWEDGWTGVNSVTTSRVNQCPVNELEDESGKPIHKIVEEFADDHDVWASAFLDAWERMQSIGYNDLKDAPQNSWLGYHTLIDMDTNLDDEMFWVDDGCPRGGRSHDGSFQYKSYEAGVRCCSNDGTTCTTPLRCRGNKMSYVDAVSKCSEDSGRLCSKDELLSEQCCGTGGNCDSFEIWTSTGNDFESFIESHKPVVFTKESVDPYVCGHQASRCATKISEVYETTGIPMEVNGQKCTNFIECNDPSHGDLSD